MRRFNPLDLKSHLEKCAREPLLLDVREQWEFDTCYIAGSELVPMREVPEFAEELDKQQEIVVICHHGIRSRQVGIYLERLGFENVINLEGGVEAWAQQIDPQMKRY